MKKIIGRILLLLLMTIIIFIFIKKKSTNKEIDILVNNLSFYTVYYDINKNDNFLSQNLNNYLKNNLSEDNNVLKKYRLDFNKNSNELVFYRKFIFDIKVGQKRIYENDPNLRCQEKYILRNGFFSNKYKQISFDLDKIEDLLVNKLDSPIYIGLEYNESIKLSQYAILKYESGKDIKISCFKNIDNKRLDKIIMELEYILSSNDFNFDYALIPVSLI